MKKITIMFLFVLLVMFVSIGHGCKNDFSDYTDIETSDGFRLLTVRNDLGKFSLEYSSVYDRTGPQGDLNYVRPFMDVTLTLPEQSMKLLYPKDTNNLEEVTASYIPAIISVHVYNTKNSPSVSQNSTARLENDIGDWGEWDNFQLLERKSITSAACEGELVSYVVDWFIPVPRGDEPLLQYHRAVYFDFGGNIWIIEAKSEMGMIEQVKADFDHIVETIKILE